MTSKHGIRHSKRMPVLEEAEFASGNRKGSGTVENVSETGLNIVIPSEGCVPSFLPGSKIEVTFRPSGEDITLQCDINWVRIDRNPSEGLLYTLAMEVAQPPPAYTKYVQKKT